MTHPTHSTAPVDAVVHLVPLLQAVLQQVAGQQPPQRQYHRELVVAQLVRLRPHRIRPQQLRSGLGLLGGATEDAILGRRERGPSGYPDLPTSPQSAVREYGKTRISSIDRC